MEAVNERLGHLRPALIGMTSAIDGLRPWILDTPKALPTPHRGCRDAAILGRWRVKSDRSMVVQWESTMPQSLSAVYIHLVFSTKERRAFLRDKGIRDALHSYLGGVSKQLECPPVRVGGVEDHVHILARFGRTITQADWVKELKRASNLWLKEQGREYADSRWQGGYADFSVSQSNLEQVKDYIAGQEAHHRKLTFQDELRALLRKHNIEFDERFVWD